MLCGMAGWANAAVVIGGATGNGDFEAGGPTSGPATYVQAGHWFNSRIDVVQLEVVAAGREQPPGAGAAATLAAASAPAGRERADGRPNILLVLTDDLGYADVGFNGSPDILTPRLDSLAEAGTIFTSAYVVHPFCGPSRMGMMTGRYPHEFGAPYNLPSASTRQYVDQGISPDETMISSVLQDAGYFTGVMGKWHMGQAPAFHPNVRGFDDFYGFLGGGHNYFPPFEPQNAAGTVWDYRTYLEHNGVAVTNDTAYVTDALSREAVRFVNQAAAGDRPFFLYLSYNAPHTPLQAKREDMDTFPDLTGDRRTFAAMVYAVDRGVGAVADALEANGQLDDTLIIFLSDNGGKESKGANNGPLQGEKGWVTEGGFRVPMFMHWPNVVPAGKTFDHPVTALDFYPTFAGLAGAAIPAGKELDGTDLWEDVLHDRNPRKGDPIYAVRHRIDGSPEGYSDVGIRRDQWKAVKIWNQDWKLFDLEQDIGEANDLSAEHPAVLSDMVSEAATWGKSHAVPLWYDSLKAGADWKSKGMPHYEDTFSLP